MSRKPIYMRTKKTSYWIMVVLIMIMVGVVYELGKFDNLNYLIENSELKGRGFKGKVVEVAGDDKGYDFYFMRQSEYPIVAVSFLFDKAGYAYDTKDGIANLAASALLFGAGDKSTVDLQEELEQKGIAISFRVTKDGLEGKLITPKKYLNDAVLLLNEVLVAPRFEKKYVDNLKTVIIKGLKTEKENPENELNLEFVKKLYGNHPYGKNVLGTEQSVASLTQYDLKKFVRDNFAKDNLIIGVVGDLTTDEVNRVVYGVFDGLNKNRPDNKLDDVDMNWKQPVLNIDRKSEQNIAVAAAKGTCRTCEDFYPLYVANYLFGGAGLNSRLNKKIREKEGLTYGGYSYLTSFDKVDLMVFGFAATKDNFEKAEKMLDEEWKNIREKGFDEKEVEMAKNYLLASHNLRFENTDIIADMLVYMQKENLGVDFFEKRNGLVENITLEQVNNAAKKYFGTDLIKANIGIF